MPKENSDEFNKNVDNFIQLVLHTGTANNLRVLKIELTVESTKGEIATVKAGYTKAIN